jgi:hypothetical protein
MDAIGLSAGVIGFCLPNSPIEPRAARTSYWQRAAEDGKMPPHTLA